MLKGEDSGKLRQAAGIVKGSRAALPGLDGGQGLVKRSFSEVTIRLDPQKALQAEYPRLPSSIRFAPGCSSRSWANIDSMKACER